jgi:hypothetical protein
MNTPMPPALGSNLVIFSAIELMDLEADGDVVGVSGG